MNVFHVYNENILVLKLFIVQTLIEEKNYKNMLILFLAYNKQ